MPPAASIFARTTLLHQEKRLQNFKRDAMLAWLRANRLNKIITSGGSNAKIGVITAGKSYLDARQAMDDLGIDEVAANRLGSAAYETRLHMADRAVGPSRVRARA